MSNFICPTCGLTSYDCGKADYKTPREIELEKKLLEIKAHTWDYDLMTDIISELLAENMQLEKKLEIAVKALEHIKRLPVRVCCDNTAEQALKEIKE